MAKRSLLLYRSASPSDEISSEQNKLIETCKRIGHRLLAGKVNFDPLKRTAAAIDARYLTEQTRRMEQCVHFDPALAIETAKCPPTLLDYSKFPRSYRISCHSIETYIHYAWRERTFLQVPPRWAVAQIQSISVYCPRFICFTHVIDGEPVHCSDTLFLIPAFVFRYVHKKMDRNSDDLTVGSYQQLIIEMTIESWRFAKLFQKVLSRLDAGDGDRYANQLRYFHRKIEEKLQAVGLTLVNLEGHPFDSGIAADPVNLADFPSDAPLLIDQMIEPIIMGPTGLKRAGTVMLRKAHI